MADEPTESIQDDRPLIIEPIPEPTPEPEPTLDIQPSTFDPVPAPPSSEPLTPVPVAVEQSESQSSTSGPEPIPEPVPEQIIEPTPEVEPVPVAPEPPTPDIVQPIIPSQPVPETTQIFDVNNLSDDQLKQASALYAKKNQKALSQKGVEKRQAIAKENLTNIKAFISSHSPANNRTIARALNLPPRRVQHYMQILTHNGTVTATGWGASREYFKK